MQRLFKVFFIILVLAWGAASLRHAQGQRGDGRPRPDADSAATLEIFDTGDKAAPASARIKWVASQSVTWAKDSEVEE